MNQPMTQRGIRVLRSPGEQGPQGPGRRRLTATVPVRFALELLEQVRAAAAADDRSVSCWIRRAVEREPATRVDVEPVAKHDCSIESVGVVGQRGST